MHSRKQLLSTRSCHKTSEMAEGGLDALEKTIVCVDTELPQDSEMAERGVDTLEKTIVVKTGLRQDRERTRAPVIHVPHPEADDPKAEMPPNDSAETVEVNLYRPRQPRRSNKSRMT